MGCTALQQYMQPHTMLTMRRHKRTHIHIMARVPASAHLSVRTSMRKVLLDHIRVHIHSTYVKNIWVCVSNAWNSLKVFFTVQKLANNMCALCERNQLNNHSAYIRLTYVFAQGLTPPPPNAPIPYSDSIHHTTVSLQCTKTNAYAPEHQFTHHILNN